MMDALPSPARLPAPAVDAILASLAAYDSDPRSEKINLGIGMYYDDMGNVPLMRCIHEAEVRLAQQGKARGYGTVEGDARFRAFASRLLGFDQGSKVAVFQSLGGTGALSLAARLLRDMYTPGTLPPVALSTPTWSNHAPIFMQAGFTISLYRYYDPSNGSLDFSGMCADISALPVGTPVVLHGCCHNPTGLDPSPAQWASLVSLLAARKLVAVVDLAYLGFGTSIEADAAPVHQLVAHDVPSLITLSFSKCFALYGERIGALVIPDCANETGARLIEHVRMLARTSYSMPPEHGASLVRTVMEDRSLDQLWRSELADMRERIKTMRRELAADLQRDAPWQNFSFIAEQRGLFSYTGLTSHDVAELRRKHAVYIVPDGRLCIAGLNTQTVHRVAAAIADVTRP